MPSCLPCFCTVVGCLVAVATVALVIGMLVAVAWKHRKSDDKLQSLDIVIGNIGISDGPEVMTVTSAAPCGATKTAAL